MAGHAQLPGQPAGLPRRLIGELSHRPLGCFTIAFCLGIAAAWQLRPAPLLLGILGGLSISLGVLLRRGGAGPVLAAAFVAGCLTLTAALGMPSHLARWDGLFVRAAGVVASQPQPRGSSLVFDVALRSIRCAGRDLPSRGRVRVVLRGAPVPPSGQPRQGDIVRAWGRLAVPGAPTNPREIPVSLILANRGVDGILKVPGPDLLHRSGREPVPWHIRAADSLRARLMRSLRETMPGPFGEIHSDVLGSILFGLKTAPLPPAIIDVFRRAGTIHILVVSGTQISLLFTIAWLPGALAARWTRRRSPAAVEVMRTPPPGPAALALGVMMTAVYAVLAGGGSPIVRAAVAAVLVAVGIGLSRTPAVAEQHPLEADRYTLIAVAALAILVQRPTALFDPGFQLSFAAVLGLSYLTPRIYAWLQGLPRWLAGSLAASIGVQIAVIPIQSWHFGQVSLMGIAGNLTAVPLAAALLALGLPASVAGLFWPAAARAVNHLNAALLDWLIGGTHVLADLPGASLPYQLASLWPAIAYYAAILTLAHWAGRARQAVEQHAEAR